LKVDSSTYPLRARQRSFRDISHGKEFRLPKILVTGAAGHVGRKTLEYLLKRHPASDLAGLVRDPAKASDLAAKGVEIRKADYFDYASLLQAYRGIDKVMLVAAHAFTDRNTQHYNAITAAREAGVKHIVFTSIIRKEGSNRVIPGVTESDIFAEETLKASGVPHTFARQGPFVETLQFYISDKAFDVGVRVPAGSGRTSTVSRDDLGAAHAAILSEPGHEGKAYALTAGPTATFEGIAGILSEIRGKKVPFVAISDQQYIADHTSTGIPEPLAQWVLNWVHAMNDGEYDGVNGDLERLIGRKPTTTAEYLKDNYPLVAPEIEAIRAQATS
jgi:NAD(P)H dehydrogenase (quinone)